MNVANKIILGTVQFGLPYGINNSTGEQVSLTEVEKLLSYSANVGIRTLDTSSAYGNSEQVLGQVIGKCEKFKIISKFPQGQLAVESAFSQSLQHLKQEKLYGYLVHHFSFYKDNPSIWDDFVVLKASGKVEKIGFSLYSPHELEYILTQNIKFDLIQIPYNIFDRSFDPYFEILKNRQVEIHARSVFLQGLFFRDLEQLPLKLQPLRVYLTKIKEYCSAENITIEELALNFNLHHPHIDGVLIGVETLEQLQENMKSIRTVPNLKADEFIKTINISEKNLLNPVNWK